MLEGILMAFSVGPVRVTARTLNARVGEQLGIGAGTLYNYVGGLMVAGLVLALAGDRALLPAAALRALPWWALAGGGVGVVFVLLSNETVPRLSSLEMTLLTMLGQIGGSLVIDAMVTGGLPAEHVAGSFLVLLGLVLHQQARTVPAPHRHG